MYGRQIYFGTGAGTDSVTALRGTLRWYYISIKVFFIEICMSELIKIMSIKIFGKVTQKDIATCKPL